MKSKAIIAVLIAVIAAAAWGTQSVSVVAPGAVQKLAGGFTFTEGPAADAQGNLYFADIPNSRIHKWSLEGKLSTFLENTGGTNGLFFDKAGNLCACQEKGDHDLLSIAPDGKITVLADKYNDKKFNSGKDRKTLFITARTSLYSVAMRVHGVKEAVMAK